MADKGPYARIYRTRYDVLGYARLDRVTWTIVSLEDPERPSRVGPHYASKAELLSDLDRYARAYGL